MGNLIKEWVKGILTENINKKVVVYAGRFQPFHKGHYATYQNLVKEFGKDSVYIGTSDKTDNIKSPFKFKEKKEIMMKMFGIPSDKIVQIKNPYAPTEIIGKFPEESTAFITVVGEKDRYRLKGKYFEPYHPDRIESGYKDKGYVYVAPAQSNPISGTDVRNWLSKGSEEQRKSGFKKAYGKFDPKIFKLVSDKLFKIESKMERFINSFDITSLLNEGSQVTTIGRSMVDDGPGIFFGNFKSYKKIGDYTAERLGWSVIDYILNPDTEFERFDTEYPIGPGRYPVSFFPTGVVGIGAARYGAIKGKEMRNKPAFAKWAKHIKKVATLTGYALVDFLDAEDAKPETSGLNEGVLNEGGAYVVCRECNKQMKQIQYRHLKYSHDMTIDEYKSKYPKAPLVCEDVKNIGDKNPMKNDTVIKKHKTIMNSKSHKKLMSKVMVGKNVGNVRDDLKTRNKTKEHRRKVSEGVKKSYVKNPNLRKERSNVGKEYGFRNNIPAEVISHYKNFEIKHHSINESKGNNSNITLPKLLKDIIQSEHKIDNRILLLCGGAYGHMNHPFDIEMNLTFGDLKTIIRNALNGNLELAREKTDGQALAISWRDDRGLIAARNKSHLKNRGAEALTIKGVADKFANRGGLTDAYNFAMKDLESAIKGLSKAQRDKIFQQGASFMNLEVIYPTSVNVIPYDQPLLVFHNTTEYNENGEAIGANQPAARILAGMIKQINKDVQQNYTIQGPPVTELPKSQNLSKQQSKFESKLNKLQSEFKLKDSDGVANYHQAWWENWVDKNSPETLTNKEKMGLVKRWAFQDKSFRLDNKNIQSSKVLEWANKIDKQDKEKMAKENTMKFEEIFLGVGAEVLSFMSSVLAANPDKAVRDMKKRLDQTIKDVQKSGDVKKIEKLRLELERLAALGGKEKIVPNEGIVFVYKGNTYKLTGAFSPLNQILGLMYF
jgi:hypothetical protein